MNLIVSSLLAAAVALAAQPPEVGKAAPDFALSNMQDKRVSLSEVTAKGPVVLIVLRGYPGYQCPYCTRQARDLMQNASGFAAAGTRVVMVYPGPGQDLGTHAAEFMARQTAMPEGFDMLLDPDYTFTNQYGLRWDAPQETAYPSTFLIDGHGVVFFRKIVKEHGGRTTAAEILEELKKPHAMQ